MILEPLHLALYKYCTRARNFWGRFNFKFSTKYQRCLLEFYCYCSWSFRDPSMPAAFSLGVSYHICTEVNSMICEFSRQLASVLVARYVCCYIQADETQPGRNSFLLLHLGFQFESYHVVVALSILRSINLY